MYYLPLIPIENAENILIEVGTIGMELSNIPIYLEFNTEDRFLQTRIGQEMIFELLLSDLTYQNYLKFYRDNPYKPSDFNLEFFLEHYDRTLVTEVPTTVFYRNIQTKLPVTIQRMELEFMNGSILDYTSKFTVGILDELAETA